jgi:hypothetical protein
LSADQGNKNGQLHYAFALSDGEGVAVNKSLAAHYLKLSADQGNAHGQFRYGFSLTKGDGVAVNKGLAAHYFKLSADQGNEYGQLCFGLALSTGDGIAANVRLARHYLNLAADQGNARAQSLLVQLSLNDAARFLSLAEARAAPMPFDLAAVVGRLPRGPLADGLRDVLESPEWQPPAVSGSAVSGTVFAVRERCGLSGMRIAVARLRPVWISPGRVLDAWQALAAAAAKVLGRPMAEDIGHCADSVEIASMALRIPTCEVEVFTKLNSMLRRLPVDLFGGLAETGYTGTVLELTSLLQASVELCAFEAAGCVVYRGIGNCGCDVEKWYQSSIGHVIVWRGFTTAMRDREKVVEKYVGQDNGVLFVISLGRRAIVADLGDGDVLIAAETGFRIDEVRRTEEGITLVIMEWVAAWSDAELHWNPWELERFKRLEVGRNIRK